MILILGDNIRFTTVAFGYGDLSSQVYLSSQWVIEEHDCGLASSAHRVWFTSKDSELISA
jgi:hypothetical protein